MAELGVTSGMSTDMESVVAPFTPVARVERATIPIFGPVMSWRVILVSAPVGSTFHWIVRFWPTCTTVALYGEVGVTWAAAHGAEARASRAHRTASISDRSVAIR